MAWHVHKLIKLDAVGLRWKLPVPGRVVAVHVGNRRFKAGKGAFWVDGNRLELVAPAEAAYAVIEVFR